MYTYQMVGLADQNGRTYVSKYGTYNKEDGFVIKPQYIHFSKEAEPNKILFSYQELINGLFHDNCWSLKVEKPIPRKMTKEEIEKELGYEIDICMKKEDEDSLCDAYKDSMDDVLKSFLSQFYY